MKGTTVVAFALGFLGVLTAGCGGSGGGKKKNGPFDTRGLDVPADSCLGTGGLTSIDGASGSGGADGIDGALGVAGATMGASGVSRL
jgi:hypothetical protein